MRGRAEDKREERKRQRGEAQGDREVEDEWQPRGSRVIVIFLTIFRKFMTYALSGVRSISLSVSPFPS